ncbi:MAG: site-2 protease family protein [bacterium]
MLITIFAIIALIMSAVVHEVSHGWAAYKLGDDTAKMLGRLTLNPIKHLDLFGSIILPLILVFSHSPFFLAWAKPVPYNPYRLRDLHYGPLKVALAGPLSNLIMATGFAILARVLMIPQHTKLELAINFLQGSFDNLLAMMSGSFINSLFVMFVVLVVINLALMIFNLIPIPPLDGSKIIYTFLPARAQEAFNRFEVYGIFVLILLIALGVLDFIGPTLVYCFSWLVGV